MQDKLHARGVGTVLSHPYPYKRGASYRDPDNSARFLAALRSLIGPSTRVLLAERARNTIHDGYFIRWMRSINPQESGYASSAQ